MYSAHAGSGAFSPLPNSQFLFSNKISPDKIDDIAYYSLQPTRNKYGRIEPNKEYNSPAVFREKANLLCKVEAKTYDLRKKIGLNIMELGKIYNRMTQGYSVKLENTETNQSFEIPIYNRFSPEYIQNQIDALYSLHWNAPPNYFLTLTLSFSKFETLMEGKNAMMKEWNRIVSWLKKYDPKTQFVAIREIQLQNTKNIHMHILISSNVKKKKFKKKVKKLKIGSQEKLKYMPEYYYKKHGFLPSNHELWYMAMRYVLKYMKKDTEDPQNSENWAILWGMKARVFSKSESLKVNPEEKLKLDLAFKNNSNLYLPRKTKVINPSLFFIKASRFNPEFYSKPVNPLYRFLGIGKSGG